MKNFHASLFSLIALTLGTSASAVQYERSMPPEQILLFEGDYAFLSRMTFQKADTVETKKIFGIKSAVTAESLLKWLDARVQYIVPETWKTEENLYMDRTKAIYPDGSIFAPYSRATGKTAKINTPEDEKKPEVLTMMSNIGAGIYSFGKSIDEGLMLRFNDSLLQVSSPRVGVIRVGKGHFYEYYKQGPDVASTPALRIYRLATLLHEARHSDGRKDSLAFMHSLCPSTLTDYAGIAACDSSLNGPYTVDATAVDLFRKSCKECTTPEQEYLRAVSADLHSRILPTREYPVFPEFLSKVLETMDLCYNYKAPWYLMSFDCSKDQIMPVTSVLMTGPSKMMDATPEHRIQ